ncbi:YfcC family protein [Salipaludibacillus sp. CF4.18]|uniref:YfcC family protein n=1 Tax=Salipaludibacillus sp. CF4.18 TaxID=3373081 RepID=UPI003EE694FD
MDSMHKEKVESYGANSTGENRKTGFKMPHVYVIMLSLILFSFLLTLLIPNGAYERQELPNGRTAVVPGTFEFINTPNIGFFDLIFSIPFGMVKSAELILGGIFIGGLFAVVQRTGLLALVIRFIMKIFRTKKLLVIPVLMIIMTTFTAVTGAMEMALVYIPALIPLMLRMGFDRFTGFAAVIVSTGAGLSVALTAPATVGIAQSISELPLYSGIELRLIVLIIVTGFGIWYVSRYASKVLHDPSTSYLYEDGYDSDFLDDSLDESHKLTGREIIGVIFMVFGFAVMLWGLLSQGWYFLELGGWYAFMGIMLGIIYGMKPSAIAETFNDGFKRFIIAIMVIGLARSVSIVLEDGQILDTIIYGLSELVSMVPAYISAVMMMIVQALFNFLVGSGSGQAVITMPIMAGLADIVGINRQTAVLAFQFGDGFSNIIYPVGMLLAFLTLAKIPYTKWLRFVIPLLIGWYTIGAVTLIVAQLIGWQ